MTDGKGRKPKISNRENDPAALVTAFVFQFTWTDCDPGGGRQNGQDATNVVSIDVER